MSGRELRTSTAVAEGLLEREQELARVGALIELAAAGEGGVLLIEGEAGLGKTSLLRAALRLGEAAGVTVLHARGGRLEHDFAPRGGAPALRAARAPAI